MNILDLKNGQSGVMLVNPGLYAMVTKVQERKTGTGQYGDWSMQGLNLRDNSGEIAAIIWGKPDLSSLAGKEIHLSALNSEGKGWQGCMVDDRKYTTKEGLPRTSRQIKASGVFLLEECQPTARPVNPGEPGYPPEPAAQRTESTNGKHLQPGWGEYTAVARSAHNLALSMEPDTSLESGVVIDRSRARLALVSTVLIAYGKRDFSYDVAGDDTMPF